MMAVAVWFPRNATNLRNNVFRCKTGYRRVYRKFWPHGRATSPASKQYSWKAPGAENRVVFDCCAAHAAVKSITRDQECTPVKVEVRLLFCSLVMVVVKWATAYWFLRFLREWCRLRHFCRWKTHAYSHTSNIWCVLSATEYMDLETRGGKVINHASHSLVFFPLSFSLSPTDIWGHRRRCIILCLL